MPTRTKDPLPQPLSATHPASLQCAACSLWYPGSHFARSKPKRYNARCVRCIRAERPMELEVLRPQPTERGVATPVFGQPAGAIQCDTCDRWLPRVSFWIRDGRNRGGQDRGHYVGTCGSCRTPTSRKRKR